MADRVLTCTRVFGILSVMATGHSKNTVAAGLLRDAAEVSALLAEHGDLLSAREAATFLGLGISRVLQLGTKGTVRSFLIGQTRFFPVTDLRAWDARRKSCKVLVGRGHKAPPVYQTA